MEVTWDHQWKFVWWVYISIWQFVNNCGMFKDERMLKSGKNVMAKHFVLSFSILFYDLIPWLGSYDELLLANLVGFGSKRFDNDLEYLIYNQRLKVGISDLKVPIGLYYDVGLIHMFRLGRGLT